MVRTHNRVGWLRVALAALGFALSGSLAPAGVAFAKVTLKFVEQLGGEVNSNGSNICVVTETCQPARLGTAPGWFKFPESVAVDQETGDAYVADRGNDRIDKLGPNGEFLLMWGWKVNKNGGNTCTKAEESQCQAGEASEAAEGMNAPISVAVDNTSGSAAKHDVYVIDESNTRVYRFGSDGKFVLMVGKEVNTNKTNICKAGETCQKGQVAYYPGNIGGAFAAWNYQFGSAIAVGVPVDASGGMVYVADEGKVQMFSASGDWAGEFPLSTSAGASPKYAAGNKASALTVDGAGDLYVTASREYSGNNQAPPGVYEFAATDVKSGATSAVAIASFDTSSTLVESMTLDPSGRLTVTERVTQGFFREQGVLFRLYGQVPQPLSYFGSFSIGGFNVVGNGMSFNTSGRLYEASGEIEVTDFEEVIVPEARTLPASGVGPHSATLEGEVNPESPSLEVQKMGFERGPCEPADTIEACEARPYGEEPVLTTPATAPAGTSYVTVHSAPVEHLCPNQRYHFRLTASNENGSNSPLANSKEFKTEALAPDVSSAPEASFVGSGSAVLTSALNPENATTEYQFAYVNQEQFEESGWAEAERTPVLKSSVLCGEGDFLDTVREVTGLVAATTYHVRLEATNLKGTTPGPEAMFMTAPPVIVQARTGSASAITATSAVISGEVNPDGQSATYAFELGVYEGAATHYGIVFSGPAGAGTVLTPESLALSGLQPGTEYAYKVKISSGYGTAAGARVVFKTTGVPSVLGTPTPPVQLSVPPVAFPEEVKVKPLTRAQQLANALKACRKKRNKRQRASCQRGARRKYGLKPKARKRSK